MSLPKISIMIPAYNQQNYIGKCIESALRIDYPNLEVVLSDDCSSDETYNIAKKYECDPRFKAFKTNKNIGRVKNYKNTLHNLVTGDWVLNCDGDDLLINSDFYKKAMDIASKNNDVVLFSANRYKFNEETSNKSKQSTYGSEGFLDGTEFFKNYFKYEHGLFHITSLYKRELALKSEFYSLDIISSDINSLLKIIIGKKIYHFDTEIALWRAHENNATKSMNVVQRAKNLELIDDLYKYHISIHSLPEFELDIWRKKSYYIRIINSSIKFLSEFKYLLFFKFIYEIKKQNPKVIGKAMINYKLILTFIFPFRIKLKKIITGGKG